MLEGSRSSLQDRPDFLKRLDLSLGRCYEDLNNPDRRLDVFRRTLKDDPLSVTGRLQLASALVAINRIDDGIEEYRLVSGVLVTVARLLLVQQLAKPTEQRRWQNVERALDIEDALRKERELDELPEVAVLRAQVLALQGKFDEALAVLTSARDRQPDEVSIWAALANLSLHLTELDPSIRLATAEQILDEAEQKLGNQVELRLAHVQKASIKSAQAARQMLSKLETSAQQFNEQDQIILRQELARAYGRIDAEHESRRIWADLAKRFPNNLSFRLVLAQLASQENDEQALRTNLHGIREIEGPDGHNGDYIEAGLLSGKAALQHQQTLQQPNEATGCARCSVRRRSSAPTGPPFRMLWEISRRCWETTRLPPITIGKQFPWETVPEKPFFAWVCICTNKNVTTKLTNSCRKSQ